MDTPGSIAGTVRATTGPREGYAFRVLDGDLIRLAGATLSLLGLGVVMGISPTLIAVTLRVLTKIPRPNRPIGFMLVGLTAGSTALLLVLQIVDPRNFEALLKHDVEGVLVRRGVDLTAGALFLIASVFMWIRARTPHRPKAPKRPPTGSPWEMVLIGALNAVVSVSGASAPVMATTVSPWLCNCKPPLTVSRQAAPGALPARRLAVRQAAWSTAPEADTPCPAWPWRPRSWNRVCRPVARTSNAGPSATV